MTEKTIIIGVTGGSASGKTSIAQKIFDSFPSENIAMIQQDSYYKDQANLTMDERLAVNYDHPLAFDNDLMIAHLHELAEGRSIQIPVYDYTAYTRSDKTSQQLPTRVIIVEGVLVLEDMRLRNLMDIKIYVDTDDDVRLIRRIKRDMDERGRSLDSIIQQYLTSVKPMHHQFVEPTKRYANIIIPNGVENKVAVDILQTKIESLLAEK
ncbi:MAG: uridine kinase [Streptococcaceae bacterium]|jgi:uridine kinase|nr:uridine kinase [Streptococcaceae bacterium]